MVQDSAASSYILKIFYNFSTGMALSLSLYLGFFLRAGGPKNSTRNISLIGLEPSLLYKKVFPLPLFTGLGCFHFARRYYGNRVCFIFLQLLRCFNSLGCLYPTYEFIGSSRGCPIGGSSDQCLFPAPRSVSPVFAPFIVSGCLGLRRKP
jgi:hypothetical protein